MGDLNNEIGILVICVTEKNFMEPSTGATKLAFGKKLETTMVAHDEHPSKAHNVSQALLGLNK